MMSVAPRLRSGATFAPNADRIEQRAGTRRRAGREARPPKVCLRSVDGGADVRELARSLAAQECDGEDADDCDQGHEKRVLNERSATLVVDTCAEPVGEEFV